MNTLCLSMAKLFVPVINISQKRSSSLSWVAWSFASVFSEKQESKTIGSARDLKDSEEQPVAAPCRDKNIYIGVYGWQGLE